MALTARQERSYKQVVDVWRFTTTLDGNGKLTSKAYTKVLSGVACMMAGGISQHTAQGFVVTETDNMFSFDEAHFEAGMDVRSGDVLKQTTGPSAGAFFSVRGNPRTYSHRNANTAVVLCSKLDKPPTGVS